jgi:hypothetical protein
MAHRGNGILGHFCFPLRELSAVDARLTLDTVSSALTGRLCGLHSVLLTTVCLSVCLSVFRGWKKKFLLVILKCRTTERIMNGSSQRSLNTIFLESSDVK